MVPCRGGPRPGFHSTVYQCTIRGRNQRQLSAGLWKFSYVLRKFGPAEFRPKAGRCPGRSWPVQPSVECERNRGGLFRGHQRKMQSAEVPHPTTRYRGILGQQRYIHIRGNGRSAAEISMAKEWARASQCNELVPAFVKSATE